MCDICKGHPNCPVCAEEYTCPDCGGWGYNYQQITIDGMDLLEKVDCEKCDGTGMIDY